MNRRLKKVDETSNNTTWYVRGPGGKTHAVYTQETEGSPVEKSEQMLYGNSRLGTKHPGSVYNTYMYEIRDHLGNVRAVIRGKTISQSGNELLSWSDYYPFGSRMRRSDIPGYGEYRYGYQGLFSEEDQGTEWYQFKARKYDPVTGRWLNTDRAGQFWSPYLGMGNDPIQNIDPDGEFVFTTTAIAVGIGALVGGGAAAAQMALEEGGIDWSSSRTWTKIGIGAATGGAIAAAPATALGAVEIGAVAFTSSAAQQAVDYNHGMRNNMSMQDAGINATVTVATAGIASNASTRLVKHGRKVLHQSGKSPMYRRYPNLTTSGFNSMFSFSKFLYENKEEEIFNARFLNQTLMNINSSNTLKNNKNNKLPTGYIKVGESPWYKATD